MNKRKIFSKKTIPGRITKTALFSFSCMLLSTTATMAADFPTFADDDLYLNHVNSSAPGRNLIVNPSANLSSCDLEADVYVLADADPTNNTCNLSVAWGWGADGTRATGGTLTPHYLPPNVNTAFQARLKFDKTKVGILTEAITVENVNDIYIQFIIVANTTVDSTVKLLLDNGEEILITDTVTGAKTLISYVHSFDSPYTGTVNLQFNANDTKKLIADDVFLSTDVIMGTSVEPAQDLTDELALVTDAALNSCLTTHITNEGYTVVSQLTSLDCAGSKSGSYGVKIFGINDFGITSLAGLEQFSSITTLKLGYNTQLSDISALASFDLKVLKLEWTAIDNDALDVIANHTNLTTLNLDYTFNVTDAAKITDTLATFDKMQELIIRSIGYPNYDWEPDADLNTNTLKITQITDGILGDLSFLANMPLLKVYSGGGNIYTSGIEGFNSTPNLVNVNLNAMAWPDNMDLSPLMSFDQDKLIVLFLQGNESYPCSSILDVVDYYAPDGKSAYTLADWGGATADDFKLDNSANGYIRIRNQCKPAADTDGDGVNDDIDAFILDAAASVDSDGDGVPDSWNTDKSAVDSTTGLTYLDAFWNDIAASIDSDGDGIPDSWNEGQSADDSTTGLTYLDDFPDDDSKSVNTAPVITAPANIINVVATDENGTANTDAAIAAFLSGATATDVDGNGTVTITHDAPTTFPLDETVVTFTATDSLGSTHTAQASVTVSDLTAPVITLLGDSPQTMALNGTYIEGSATAQDNVDGDVTDDIAIDESAVDISTEGTYTVTYTVLDAEGNVGIATRSIIVQDVAAPLVTAPANITVEATSSAGTANSDENIVAFLLAATAEDAVDGTLIPSAVDVPDVYALGDTLVTFEVTDNDGYKGSGEATITVVDTTAPVITLNGESAVTLAPGSEYTEDGATAADIVDANVSVVIGGDTVDTSIQDTYNVTYTAVDSEGNPADTVTRVVTVQDASAPVVTPPANITVAATDSDGTAISDNAIGVFLDAATAIDDIDGSRVVTSDALNVFPIGTTTVTFSAMDSAGNEGTAQATITITDQTAPVITLVAGAVEIIAGDNYVEPGFDAFDNVDGDISANVIITDTLDTATPGTYIITYNVSDDADNAAQVTRRVVVNADADGDGVIDDEDAFPTDIAASIDTDGDGAPDSWNDGQSASDSTTGLSLDAFSMDVAASQDWDKDGSPDSWNVGFSADDSTTGLSLDTDIDNDGVLNENDADDYAVVTRANDLDRDGVADDIDSDGVDIVDAMLVIETALLAQIDSAISLDATAIDTDITADVAAFVSEALSGTNIAGIQVNSIVDGAIKRSGAHDVIIELINGVGSVVSFDALMHITPRVSIPETVFVKANEAITFNVDLSGSAVFYPVTLNYRLETIDDPAAVIEQSTVTIAAGETIQMTLPAQSRGDYQVVFSEGDARNAALIGNAVTKIIAEENTPPTIAVALMSDGNQVTIIDETDTDAAIGITITDVDMTSAHTLVVTLNDVEVLNTLNDVSSPTHVIALDVATLGAGSQAIVVVVTELDTEELFSTSAAIEFNIVAALPVLAEAKEDGSIADSDGDGVSDAEEGFGDADGDGIADYLDDASLAANEQRIGSGDAAVTVTVDEGLTITVGSTLKRVESGLSDDIGVAVTSENFISVLEIPVEAQAKLEASLADVKSFLMPLIDFKITGARAGATVNMILPLPVALTAKTEYRKLKEDGSLIAFDISNGNAIMSAMTDAQGECPAADSDVWQAGLVAGNDCVKLAIVDGGANDDDGLANGVIVDPAVIVHINSAPEISLNSQATLNEGETISLNVIAGDVDNDDLSYTWTQTQGSTATLLGTNTDTLTLTAPSVTANEVLSFTVIVSDGVEAVEKDIDITVADLNTAPTLSTSVSSTSIEGGDVIILKASATDEQGDAISYSWVQTNGETVTIFGNNTMFATFIAPNSNTTLSFEVTVSDGFKTTSLIMSVDVTEPKKDGGSFGISILLLLAGLFGLRRRIKPS